jgi:deoxycytidylate deaminase
MQPGVNFRVTDKNKLVAVKDAAPPAILPFGKLSPNGRYSGHFIGASWSVQFRWVQPLGNELRSGLQLSSNARTAHAERLIASRAAQTYDLAFLARCTLYTSAEPCATCAGAIYWAGIGRVVCGRARRRSKSRPARTLDLPCGLVSPPVNGRPLGPAA